MAGLPQGHSPAIFLSAFQPRGLCGLPARTASAAITIAAATIAATAATSARTSTAAATTTRTASTAAATIAAFCARASFIDGDGPPSEITPVQSFDRRTGLRAVRHFDETESAQSAAKLITNKIHFTDSSIFSKSLS